MPRSIGKVHQETGAKTRVLPQHPAPVPLLVLTIDPGQNGCAAAGVAFAMYHLKLMVYASLDKYPRMIRDLEQARSICCRQIFTKAKLFYAHLATVNKGPAGSGANGIQKEQWMKRFERHIVPSSPLFLKHLPKLSENWGMDCNTEEEHWCIMERLFRSVPSFSRRMSHPKLCNDFAWNTCVSDQICLSLYGVRASDPYRV